jgi:FAD dependent oxidoreductase
MSAVLAGSYPLIAASKVLTFDLVVYGSTPSGIMAAVAAARSGLKVALVDKAQHVGGMVTSGLSYTDRGKTETIGGIPREFFERVGRHYNEPVEWGFEPHVAEQVLHDMLQQTHVEVFLNSRLRETHGVEKGGPRILRILTEDGSAFSAQEFVDSTYDGDLMNQAGVSNTWGREAASQYKESLAGVLPTLRLDLQFRTKVSSYTADGSLLPGVSSQPKGELGQGDKKVPAYNFRFCFSHDQADQVPYPRPDGYDPKQYELLARYLPALEKARGRALELKDVFLIEPLKGNKADFNNMGGFSTDQIGANWDYPAASYKRKEEIVKALHQYDAGLLYFIAHDPRVPSSLQKEMNEWGMAKDEFTDTGHWPWRMYVREARRMVSDFVFTQHDVLDNSKKPDSIGMGSYQMDSHNVQRVPTADGGVENEGDMYAADDPYEIPYRAIIPKRAEATNLLVPVCVSASHAAYGTIRQEPVFMIVGQATGDAAAIAVHQHLDVQDVPASTLQTQLLAEHVVLHWHR